jgi:hypothetical protein
MRVPVLHADTDPDDRDEHGDTSAGRVKAPSILNFHPGPQKGTMILELKLEYIFNTGEEEWHKSLYNVKRFDVNDCVTAVRQSVGISGEKNFRSSSGIDAYESHNTVTFAGHIFCYHDLPIPTEEEEAELVSRIKAYATEWLKDIVKHYRAILAKVEKIPENPWRSYHS